MSVVETITVDFPVDDRHGIFRFFDTHSQNDPRTRWVPRDIEVSMDGTHVPVTTDLGRFTVLRIGDPSSYVEPGQHTYEIRYRIDGVLQQGTDVDAPTQLHWDLIPGGWGWEQAIDDARLTVHLPTAATQVRCSVGTGTDRCQPDGVGTGTLTVQAQGLQPRTAVTLLVGLDLPSPAEGSAPPWPPELDEVLGTSVAGVVGVVLAAVAVTCAGIWVLVRRIRETDPPFPLRYTPPDGIGPAQAAYIMHERVGEEQLVATLLYAAERGAITLDHHGDGTWTITDRAGAQGWERLDPVTQTIARLLPGPGSSFSAFRGSPTTGYHLRKALTRLESTTYTWASRAGLMVSNSGCLRSLVLVAAAAAALWLALWNPFHFALLALIPGLFAVMAPRPSRVLGMGARGTDTTRRTPAGRELWSQVGGFARTLSTPSAQQRMGFSGREGIYTAYVPWAVAFGCADEWTEKYRTETGAEPPVVRLRQDEHARSGEDAHRTTSTATMVAGISSTVHSAITSYQSTLASSSSSSSGSSSSSSGSSSSSSGGGGGGGSW